MVAFFVPNIIAKCPCPKCEKTVKIQGIWIKWYMSQMLQMLNLCPCPKCEKTLKIQDIWSKSGAIKTNIVCPKLLFWENREKLFHFLIFDVDIKWWRFLDSIGCDTLNKSNLMLIPPKMCSYSINKNPKIEITIVCPKKHHRMSKISLLFREKHRMSIGHTIFERIQF